LPKAWRREIQIITPLSSDQENDADLLAINPALDRTDVVFRAYEGPVGAVRVGMINNELILNPTLAQLEGSDLDLTSSAPKIYCHGGSRKLKSTAAAMLKACEFAHNAHQVSTNYRMKSAPL